MITKKRISSCLVMVLCMVLLSTSAAAYERVQIDTPVSLTLTYQHGNGGQPVSGMSLRLYKVYDMTDAVHFTPTKTFLDAYTGQFEFDLQKWTENGTIDWPKMASTLESLLLRDSASTATPPPAPLRTETTNETGSVAFKSTDQDVLTPGLYLLMGDSLRLGSYTYIPQTFLLSLPTLQETDAWHYEVQAKGKLSFIEHGGDGGGGDHSISVVKEWVDQADTTRPDAVTVQLLKDGEVYETTTLNETNHWQYTWNHLSDYHRWQLAEVAIPADYTVSVSQVGTSFVVTNTKTVDLPDPDVPTTDQPGIPPADPTNPTNPGDPQNGIESPLPELDIPEGDVPLANVSLPQTGMVWWPVQLLTVLGLLLFISGFALNRRGKKHHNDD